MVSFLPNHDLKRWVGIGINQLKHKQFTRVLPGLNNFAPKRLPSRREEFEDLGPSNPKSFTRLLYLEEEITFVLATGHLAAQMPHKCRTNSGDTLPHPTNM